jgi:hypothetical protein
MSRVVYTDQTASTDQESLRAAHGVRLVTGAEEGTGVNALPEGTYGFTYSPALPNAPLFAVRRYRCYETHKVAGGEIYVIGFATVEGAAQLAANAEATLTIQPEADGGSSVLVKVPYSRIRRHRQYAAPNEHGFQVTVGA